MSLTELLVPVLPYLPHFFGFLSVGLLLVGLHLAVSCSALKLKHEPQQPATIIHLMHWSSPPEQSELQRINPRSLSLSNSLFWIERPNGGLKTITEITNENSSEKTVSETVKYSCSRNRPSVPPDALTRLSERRALAG